MYEDEKLAFDESRRMADHAAVKGAVRSSVREQIAQDAERARSQGAPPGEPAGALVDRFRGQAVSEVVQTDQEIGRARVVARISQLVDYIFCLIYGLIGLMILLDLVGANRGAGFYQLISRLTSPLLAAFRGLVDDPSAEHVRFRLSYLVALFVYALLHVAINGMLRIIAHRRTSV
jgi:uncharacterized protein YggT (Ycf19 family)